MVTLLFITLKWHGVVNVAVNINLFPSPQRLFRVIQPTLLVLPLQLLNSSLAELLAFRSTIILNLAVQNRDDNEDISLYEGRTHTWTCSARLASLDSIEPLL